MSRGPRLDGSAVWGPLLLVEGDDDYRIWSQVSRHHVVSFSVLPSGGQQILNHQRALERVLNALREPVGEKAGCALIDGDKGKPAENAETPQQHVAFIQLNCRESENLFLTDEVLALFDNLNWEQAQQKIAWVFVRVDARSFRSCAVGDHRVRQNQGGITSHVFRERRRPDKVRPSERTT